MEIFEIILVTISALEISRNKVRGKVQSSAEEPWRSVKMTRKNLNAITHSQPIFSIVTVGSRLPPKNPRSVLLFVSETGPWACVKAQFSANSYAAWPALRPHVRFIPSLLLPVLPLAGISKHWHKPPFLYTVRRNLEPSNISIKDLEKHRLWVVKVANIRLKEG